MIFNQLFGQNKSQAQRQQMPQRQDKFLMNRANTFGPMTGMGAGGGMSGGPGTGSLFGAPQAGPMGQMGSPRSQLMNLMRPIRGY